MFYVKIVNIFLLKKVMKDIKNKFKTKYHCKTKNIHRSTYNFNQKMNTLFLNDFQLMSFLFITFIPKKYNEPLWF